MVICLSDNPRGGNDAACAGASTSSVHSEGSTAARNGLDSLAAGYFEELGQNSPGDGGGVLTGGHHWLISMVTSPSHFNARVGTVYQVPGRRDDPPVTHSKRFPETSPMCSEFKRITLLKSTRFWLIWINTMPWVFMLSAIPFSLAQARWGLDLDLVRAGAILISTLLSIPIALSVGRATWFVECPKRIKVFFTICLFPVTCFAVVCGMAMLGFIAG